MVVAIITDFGVQDAYIGTMKGVMLGIASDVQFVDITHHIEPQNVRQAAIILMNSVKYFPTGTVFLVVVDPGVGTIRRPIAVKADGNYFVAPDNGVLTYALAHCETVECVEIDVESIEELSYTFHGRDIFAPTAARLVKGESMDQLGTELPRLITMPPPTLDISEANIVGEVVHIDRFGNIVTSIGHLNWKATDRLTLSSAFGKERERVPLYAENVRVTINEQVMTGIKHTYGDSGRGGLLCLVGSSKFLEISVNQGNAAERLDAAIGDRVSLEILS